MPAMRQALARLLAVLLGTTTLVACGGDDEPRQVVHLSPASALAAIPILDVEGLRELFAAERGKTLLVNAWATWCLPCQKELPELQSFAAAYAARGVEVIAVSLDDPLVNETALPQFVAAHKLKLRVVQAHPEPVAALRQLVDPGFAAELPTTFVIDPRGQLRERLVGARTRAEFEIAVRPLVGGPPPALTP